jgi:phosphatidylethanolamine-binding protein (PEBP) family uncharacterized protein
MPVLQYIEYSLSWLFRNAKAHDANLFTKGPAFKSHLTPTIKIHSPDCGPSESNLKPEYTQFGTSRIPVLEWEPAAPNVKEYMLICEDPDAPFKMPSTHGLYYSIPPHVTRLSPSDFEVAEGGEVKKLRGPLKLGKNRRGTVYTAPRPLLGHGPHRYLYELIALKEKLDETKMGKVPTKDELAVEILDKVAGWGIWVGVFENKWE